MNFLRIMTVLFVTTGTALAQTGTGSIQGVVQDEAGEPVSGAVVTLNGTAYADTADVAGRFDIDHIPAGSLVLTATKAGAAWMPHSQRITASADSVVSLVILLRQRTYAADEVVVIASPLSREEGMEREPSQVDVVTRAEFEVNAVTVEDVIASTPSASISTYGGLGSFSEVSLRGSYSNQVKVYLDGMLLNQSAGGSVNLGLIPLANVDHVEVWRSGAPARFGGDGVGGAINIVTRPYDRSRGSFSVGGGSFGTVTGSGVMGFGPQESRIEIMVDAASSRNDFAYTSDNGTPLNTADDYSADRKNNAFRSLNGLVKYRRLIGSSATFELAGHMLYSRKNIPASQHILNSGASLETVRSLLQATLVWTPPSHAWFEVVPTMHSIVSRERYEDPDNRVGWGAQDNLYETVTFQAMLPAVVRWGAYGEATVTAVAGHESYDPEHRLEPVEPLSCGREHIGMVGDIALHSPGHRIALTANVRRDRYFSDYTGQLNAYTPDPPSSTSHHITNAQTGVLVEPHELVSFRLNYGDNWRVPGFYELFGDRGGVVSKPGLQPEHAYRWDAGMRMLLPHWTDSMDGRLDVVRFDTDYRNLIQWYANSYGFIEPGNVARSYIRGTEIVWNVNLFKCIGLRGNWTFQESKVTDSTKSYHRGKKLPNRPERYGTATAEWICGCLSIFWTADHKDEYYLDRANQEHLKYPGRTIQDSGFALGLKEGTMRLRVVAENITDKRTFDMYGMPKPGRSYTITFTCSL